MPKPRRVLTLLLVFTIAIVGCQDRDSANTQTPDPIPARENQLGPGSEAHGESARDRRRSVATNAKDALSTQLSARLMSIMQSDGPAAAIDVCRKEAVMIADAVGEEHGVRIGRTSYKLRNSANAPRDWVKPFVENRSGAAQYVDLDDGTLGALYPIHLNVKCLMCHGGPDDVLDAVKSKLAKLYPDDQATGFKLDELRGWFWVEVPGRSPNQVK